MMRNAVGVDISYEALLQMVQDYTGESLDAEQVCAVWDNPSRGLIRMVYLPEFSSIVNEGADCPTRITVTTDHKADLVRERV